MEAFIEPGPGGSRAGAAGGCRNPGAGALTPGGARAARQDIEARLKQPIPCADADLGLPPAVAAAHRGGEGAPAYGAQRDAGAAQARRAVAGLALLGALGRPRARGLTPRGARTQAAAARVAALRPAVEALTRLETQAQASFFALQRRCAPLTRPAPAL